MSFRYLIRSSVLALAIAGAGMKAADAGETINYTYDSLGRLIAAKSTGTVNNNEAASYCYDGAGNRTFAQADDTGGIADCSAVPAPTPTPTPTPGPSISINDGSTIEGGSITFSATLSSAYSSSVSVDYATATGSALSGDFYMTSGTLTFSAGQMSKSFVVVTRQDTKTESTETFSVSLSNPTGGASIGDGYGVGTIIDDDDGGCALC